MRSGLDSDEGKEFINCCLLYPLANIDDTCSKAFQPIVPAQPLFLAL